ncbi:MAG: 30S ribosomal protein S9 [Longimicrobiales bacterium]
METTARFHGLGRRKTSVARVWLRPGAGQWVVNGRPLAEHLPRPSHQQHAQEPLLATELMSRFDVQVNVDGGGQTGQAGAIRMGIARALVKYDEDLRPVMRQKGLLTRDPREVERKKPGRPGARKRFQFSKR